MAKFYSHWSEALADYRARGEASVLVTVLLVKGSAPRETGTKMLVGPDRIHGTIGGGQLEHSAIGKARALLTQPGERQHIEQYPLGARLGQCCGGYVTVLFECFTEPVPHIAVFGAGHVGKALVTILAALPVSVTWLDSRQDEFPECIPEGVRVLCSDAPEDEVAHQPAGTSFVVMTHLHPLDYAITEAVLKRGDAAYLGVIGSTTKAQRFRMRLAHHGFQQAQIDFMTCPIGLPSVPGKHPMEVAVAVAGELIAHYHKRAASAVASTAQDVKLLRQLQLGEPQD